MKNVLVAGVETIVGGNLAMALSQTHRVAGLSAAKNLHIAGCSIHDGVPNTPESIQRELAIHSPDLVVVAGPAANPIWSLGKPGSFDTVPWDAAVDWARATAGTRTHLIVISSDAVFHGPWMFHEENCSGVCTSAPAAAIRHMEAQVARLCPAALIVRTNAFGWSPQSAAGWLESLLEQIAVESPLRAAADNYATPIEASLLSGILIELWDRKLEGMYHVGGSERVNFVHFAHRLAQEFQLPRPRFQPGRGQQPEAAQEFGQGETSLNSGKVKRAVGTSLPMLSESLRQLRELSETGQRDMLRADSHDFAAHAA